VQGVSGGTALTVSGTVAVSGTSRCQTETLQTYVGNNLAANVQAITGTSSATTLCGVSVNNTVATTNTSIMLGAGTTCASGLAAGYPAFTGLIGLEVVGFSGQQIVAQVASGTNVCVYVSGTGANANVAISFVQP
jgi:hypothetical protein